MIDLINKKRLGKTLTKEELQYIIDGYLDLSIPDYQMASLLMAITINGMSEQETIDLTKIMLESGDKIDLSKIKGIKVDKHSTGGIGDKTTLILAPLLACLDVPVAKMSGRGLGITGGTIDKLESIKGFQTNINENDFIKNVNEVGACIAGTTGNLVPADKKIYALRDVTATVSSIPLIASSIMSKKLASGADKIVIDLKVGAGAFINNLKDAKTLASLMVKIGNFHKRETICVLTNMNEPLGYAIGNTLEVQEVIDFLKGVRAKDLENIVIELATYMLMLGKNETYDKAKEKVIDMLNTDLPLKKLEEIVTRQGGNLYDLKNNAKTVFIKSTKQGYIHHINAQKIGIIANNLGAGKNKLEDKIDHAVGIKLHKKTGDFVEIKDILATIALNEKDVKLKDVLDCFVIEKNIPESIPLIIEVIR